MSFWTRKLPRLSGYDDAQSGYYFVTLCTHDKQYLFGSICALGMKLNDCGMIAQSELLRIPEHFDHVLVDAHIIMPNHIHCILAVSQEKERSRPFPTLSNVIGLYKSGVSKQIRLSYPQKIVWQKSFYDRILRDDIAYTESLRYIEENPLKWALDEFYGRVDDAELLQPSL